MTSHTLGQIAALHPQALVILRRNRMDAAFEGEVQFEEACAQAGADASVVLREIEEARRNTPFVDWTERPIEHLVLYIEGRYHRPLDADVTRLIALFGEVVQEEARLSSALDLLGRIREHMLEHTAQEEAGLHRFVLLHPGERVPPELHDDAAHHEVSDLLRQLCACIADLTLAPGARPLVVALEALEQAMHEHLHLENNVLLPRLAALGAAPGRPGQPRSVSRP